MQPFSKASTWTNGETNHDNAPSMHVEGGESDEEFIEIKAKPKKPFGETVESYPSIRIGENSAIGGPTESTAGSDMKVVEVAENQNLLLTDGEWLRSKTNRLLDLTDTEPYFAQVTTEEERLKSATDHTINTHEGSAVENGTEIEGEESAEVDTIVQEIRKTGRLFLRNLPYTTTEEELWSAFEPYGSIQEVT